MLKFLWHRFWKSRYETTQSWDFSLKLHNFLFFEVKACQVKIRFDWGWPLILFELEDDRGTLQSRSPNYAWWDWVTFNIFLTPQRSISHVNMILHVKGFEQRVIDINLYYLYDLFIEHLINETLVCSPRNLQFELYNFVSVHPFLSHERGFSAYMGQ